jgi:uncharacterized OB-fold protein
VSDYLVLDDAGPRLVATRCVGCGAVTLEPRVCCGRCGRREFATAELAPTGVVTAYTVVEQSVPGIPTPYVSVVVAFDGGGHLRSGLRGVDPRSDEVRVGLPVQLAVEVAGVDKDGAEVVVPVFEPA